MTNNLLYPCPTPYIFAVEKEPYTIYLGPVVIKGKKMARLSVQLSEATRFRFVVFHFKEGALEVTSMLIAGEEQIPASLPWNSIIGEAPLALSPCPPGGIISITARNTGRKKLAFLMILEGSTLEPVKPVSPRHLVR